MATILRPSDSRAFHRIEVGPSTVAGSLPAFAATAAAGFRRACNALARLIDITLMVVFLLGDLVLAASLGFMIAGQIVG